MKNEEQIATVQQDIQPAKLMEAIITLATNPEVRIDVIERLVALQERQVKQQAETAFARDLTALQSEIPQIERSGIIRDKQKNIRSRYALIEDVDVIIRPLLHKHGFSVSFNEEAVNGLNYTISCKLLHRDGHSDTKRITLPLDKNEYRTSMQDRKSTESFAHRNLLFMHLNIVQRGQDNDGQDESKITQEQEQDLIAIMEEVKQDKAKFFKFFGIEKVSDLPAKEFEGAIRDLERKRR